MRIRSLVSSAAIIGTLLASSALVSEALAQKGTVLAPSTGWAVSKVDNSAGPYCALARKYNQNTVLTVARNLQSETSFALDFQRPIFRTNSPVSIVLDPGAGQQRAYDITPVSTKAFVVKLGRDNSFFKALDRTGMLRVEMGEKSYHFNIADMDSGQLKLDACVANMVMPAAGEETPLTPALGQGATQQANNSDQGHRQEINALRRQITSLKESNESLKVQVEARSDGVAETSESVSQLAGQVRSLEDENAKLKREIDLAKSTVPAAVVDDAGDEVSRELTALQDENLRLKAELQTAPPQEEALASLETEIQLLQTQNEELKSSLSSQGDGAAVVNGLRAQISTLKAENEQINAKVLAAKDAVRKEFEYQIASMASENTALKSNMGKKGVDADLLDQLRQQIAQAENENRLLQETAAQAQVSLEGQLREENMEAIEAAKMQQAARVAALENELSTLRSENVEKAQALVEVGQGTADLQALQEENAALELKLAASETQRAQAETLVKRIEVLEIEKGALEEQLASSQIMDDSASADFAALENENATLKLTLDENKVGQGQLALLETEIETLKADNAALQESANVSGQPVSAEFTALEEENAALKMAVGEGKAEAEGLASLESEIETLRADNAALQESANASGQAVSAEFAVLEEENAALKLAVDEGKAEAERLASLESDVEALRADNAALQEQITASTASDDLQVALNENAELVQQIQDKDAELSELAAMRQELAALKEQTVSTQRFAELEQQRDTLQAELGDLKVQLSEFKGQDGDARQQIAALESQRDELKVALVDVVEVVERYKAESLQQGEQIVSLKSENKDLKLALKERAEPEPVQVAAVEPEAEREPLVHSILAPAEEPAAIEEKMAKAPEPERAPSIIPPSPSRKPQHIVAAAEPVVEEKAVPELVSIEEPLEEVYERSVEENIRMALLEVEIEMRNTDHKDQERMQQLSREYASLKELAEQEESNSAEQVQVVAGAESFPASASYIDVTGLNEAQIQEQRLKRERDAAEVRGAALEVAETPAEVPEENIVLSQSADPFEDLNVEGDESVQELAAAAQQPASGMLEPLKARQSQPVQEASYPTAKAFSVEALIVQAAVSTPEKIKRVKDGPENVTAAYQWNGGSVYGSAEQRPISSPAQFDDLVKDYLERTQSRCPGEFAIVPYDSVDGGSLRADSYEVACVGGNVSSGASLLFFNQGGTFTVVAHEAPAEELGTAMNMRNQVMQVVAGSVGQPI